MILSKHPFTVDLFIKEFVALRARTLKYMRDFVEEQSKTDKNLYFFDGNKLFGDKDIYEMTVDGTHPTDLGFYTVANVLTPIIRDLLDGKGMPC